MTGQTTPEAVKLLQEGAEALAWIEHQGVRVDKGYLDQAIASMELDIGSLNLALTSDKIWSEWRKMYGAKANLGSRPQLNKLLKSMGYESKAVTDKGGRSKTDKSFLDTIDLDFVRSYVKAEELKKAKGAYLEGIRRELVRHPDGHYYVHPSYNLNLAVSHRSSSSGPNFQNVPVRNAEMAAVIRRCYVARPGNHFVECDLSQIEVRVEACHSLDPNLIRYIEDKSTDMHRDMACQIFMIPEGQVTKEVRHTAKNRWVFPLFYGAVYFQCAKDIWEAVARQDMKLKDGTSVLDHLKSRGVRTLGNCDPDHIRQNGTREGTFVHHMKLIQDDFWGVRFKVDYEWKEKWYQQYLRDGGFMTKTGFWIGGRFKRNEVLNLPIQGTSFQIELWSLIELVKEIRRYRMRTKVVGEIHDSDQSDVPPAELNAYLDLNHEIKTERILKAWDWIVVPLEIECEVTEVGASWLDKKVFTRGEGGTWSKK